MKYSFLFLLLFVFGCATVSYTSVEEKVYFEKCGGCHRVYKREDFTKEKWINELEEMTKRAKLSDEDKKMILEFLTKNGQSK